MPLMKTRTWDNTEWPGIILVQPEKPNDNKKGSVPLGQAFDLIMLVEYEFPNSCSHEAQAQ